MTLSINEFKADVDDSGLLDDDRGLPK